MATSKVVFVVFNQSFPIIAGTTENQTEVKVKSYSFFPFDGSLEWQIQAIDDISPQAAINS